MPTITVRTHKFKIIYKRQIISTWNSYILKVPNNARRYISWLLAISEGWMHCFYLPCSVLLFFTLLCFALLRFMSLTATIISSHANIMKTILYITNELKACYTFLFLTFWLWRSYKNNSREMYSPSALRIQSKTRPCSHFEKQNRTSIKWFQLLSQT